nr:hypothetical protein [Massilia sp. YIM B04103]
MEQTTYTGYDLAGNLAMQEDATGRKTWSTYDAFHHKTEQSDVNGSMFWTVDAYGKITSHTDLGGGKTTYEHNELNQVTKQSIGTVSRSNVQGIDVREAAVTIRGQERSYEYRDGVLVKVTDREEASGKVLSTTSYSYNLAGKRSRERTVDKDGVVVQDNFIEYDTLGRMKEVGDNHFNVKFYYDLNGNRTLVKSHYVVGNDQENTVDAYNEFDAMNRETIANGEWDSASNRVVKGKNGHQIAYDQIGLRLSDSYQYKPTGKDYSNSTVEKYEYDAAGRLTMVRRDGYLTDERQYDAAGRVVRSGAGIGEDGNKLRDFGVVAETRTYAYDAAGRATRVKYRNNDYYGKDNGSKNTNFKDDIYYASVNERGGGYDLAGNLSAYSIVPPKYAEHTVVRNNYIRFDGYKSLTVEAEREQHKATTTYEYDAFGNVVKVSDSGKEALTRTFTNDTDGRVLRKQQDGVLTRSLIVNGELLGESNNQLNPDGLANPYEPANSGANTAAPSIYYAQEGDNLQSIAKALWGDSKLWYLIADANSRSTPDVNAGEMLIIPTRANTLHNDHSTFKPYNQAEQIGDTMPTLPAPAGPKAACGGAGQLIMVVVAVVVTYFTGGLAGSVMGQMLGAAMGSVASQAVGMALGIQDSFSWKGVALAAVSAGVTQGVGSMVEGSWLAGAGWQAAAGRAVISNVISQGIGNITHLQDGFSWRSVAAAGVGGAINSSVNDEIGLSDKGVAVGGLKFGERLFKETISGLASGTASAIARGGKISVARIATDAFGNALGSSLADAINNTDYMQTRALRSTINAERSIRGLDPINSSDSDSMDAIRGIVEARSRRTVAGRLDGYRDQLNMYGMGSDDVNDVIGRLGNAFHGRRDVQAIPSDDMSNVNKAILTGAATPERTAAFGALAVDGVLQGSGRLVNSFGETLAANPLARYALEGLDFAAGPAIWAARKAVTNFTPVGEMLEHGQEAIINNFADRFSSVGYGADDAMSGGVGGLTLGTMAATGIGGALTRLSGVSNILTSVRNRLGALAPDVSISPFAHELSRGSSIRTASNDLGLVELNPTAIRTTQTTVKQQGATIPKLVESMRKNGFVVEPDRLIDVVRMPDGGLTSLDNTRILAAQRAGVTIQARVFEHTDLLPDDLDYVSRFIGRKGEVPTTFGEAVQNRISNQSSAYRNLYPNGSLYIGSAH